MQIQPLILICSKTWNVTYITFVSSFDACNSAFSWLIFSLSVLISSCKVRTRLISSLLSNSKPFSSSSLSVIQYQQCKYNLIDSKEQKCMKETRSSVDFKTCQSNVYVASNRRTCVETFFNSKAKINSHLLVKREMGPHLNFSRDFVFLMRYCFATNIVSPNRWRIITKIKYWR